jgi:hypothetical protein
MPHPYLLPGSTLVSAILEACRSAGRRAPQLVRSNRVSGSAQDANLLTSDYQKPLPDSAGHGWTSRLTSSDASG